MSQYEAEKKDMRLLTQKYVDKLTAIWEQMFHQDTCRDNLHKLLDHTTHFYDELVSESLSRKAYIENEINVLKKEAENLKRLLKTDVQLPCYDNNETPLIIVQSELDKSLEDLREQLRLRKDQICELLLEQEALCEELGEPPRALLADPLPTAGDIDDFRMYLDTLRNERVERMNRISTMRREIKNFLQILELNVNTETEDRLLNHRQIKMNKETFEGLKRLHDCYGAQVKELRETINGMRNKVHALWDRLGTSPNTRHKFNRYNDYNQHTYDKFYVELQRCETLKSQNIKLFVQQIRQEISKWWELTLKSETQKSRFSNFTSNCYTDDLLVLHEMELEDLKLFYETNKQIFDLYADRNILWDRMNALEAKASEPGRYNNRGGQLLKEEKERKTIASKLPKIEQQICELVQQYEQREHAPFLVYGENIIDVIATQWEKKQKNKELLQTARKNAAKTPGPTPSKTNSTMRTPMSLKNTSSVSSLRKTPSTTSLASNAVSAQKRKLNPTDRSTPMAKRSLMHALNSPSVSANFLKPSTSKNIHGTHAGTTSKNNKSATNFKSPHKKTKLIATTIRRRSGRLNGSFKKRRSLNKNSSSVKQPIPKIVVDSASDGYITDNNSDDTYDSFQKCIEPASRSSIIHGVSISDSSRTTRMQKLMDDENTRLAKLPRPRVINRTPSRIKKIPHHSVFSTSYTQRSPTLNNHHSPASCTTTGRKLTTKNLPIII